MATKLPKYQERARLAEIQTDDWLWISLTETLARLASLDAVWLGKEERKRQVEWALIVARELRTRGVQMRLSI